MKKNVASQNIGAQMITAADGTAFTGSVTAYVTGDAGTQAAGSVGSGACVSEGRGYHTYAPAQAETNYDLIAFTFTGTGAIPATVQIFTTFPQTGDNFARLGAPAGASVSADVAAVKTDTAATLVDTAEIGAAGAGLTGLGGMSATMKAQVNTEADTALTDYDAPTNTEMEARTLVAASYFDPAVDAVATVTLVTTATSLTNLPAIPTNWLTAAGTAADFTTEIQTGLATAATLSANTSVAGNNTYSGTASGTPSTTAMVSDVSITADDQYKGRIILFKKNTSTASLQGQATDITACTAASNTLTFTALTNAPSSGDTFDIV